LQSYLQDKSGFSTNSKKVGVLYDTNQTERSLVMKRLEDSFGFESSQIWDLGFRIQTPPDGEGRGFSPKDFSAFGNPESETIQQFLQQDFKYIFNYFTKEQLYLAAVSAQANAGLKIGFQNAIEGLNDVSLSMDIGVTDFFKESSKYITQIQL